LLFCILDFFFVWFVFQFYHSMFYFLKIKFHDFFSCIVLQIWWTRSKVWKISKANIFFIFVLFSFLLSLFDIVFLIKNGFMVFFNFLFYHIILISWPRMRVSQVNPDELASQYLNYMSTILTLIGSHHFFFIFLFYFILSCLIYIYIYIYIFVFFFYCDSNKTSLFSWS